MLLIEQIYEPSDVASDYVKCLACKHGRLCDKPVGEKVMAIAIRGDIPKSTAHRIILECPKCGQDIVLKKTKKGRRYYGCIGHPECDFMSWQKPVKEEKSAIN